MKPTLLNRALTLTPGGWLASGRVAQLREMPRRGAGLFCLLLVPVFVAGCRLIQTTAELPGQTVRAVTPGMLEKKSVDPVEVQQAVLRFADEFSTRLAVGVDNLQRSSNVLSQATALRWKIAFGNEICSIASGPNAVGNLLDMTAFVTVIRTSLEEHWQPEIFGKPAEDLVASCRQAETEVWTLAGTVLKPAQLTELRQAIKVWCEQNALPENVLAARAVGFASQVAEVNKQDASKPESVFSLLRVDPLAGMDPAVREITQTRLFAERALYVTQKLPTLIRWQTELLTLNAVEMPAVQQVVSNSTQIAASVERFARVAEQLPGQLSTEREEILKALAAQEKEVAALMTHGTTMSDSLNTTLITFDALMKRFGVGEPNTNTAAPPDPNAAPFRILDYAQTAAQLEVTARQLTELLVTLDRTIGSTNLAQLSAQVTPVVQQAQASGKEVVDYAFGRALLLVAVVLVAACLYRFIIARRLFSKTNPL
jgi:hypothetical protein